MSASVPIGKPLSAAGDADESTLLAAASLPSWLISLIGHLLILASLWPIHMATSLLRDAVVTSSVVEEENSNVVQQDLTRFDTAVLDKIGNQGDSTGPGERIAPLGAAIETPRAPLLNVQGTVAALGTRQIAIKRPMLDVGAATPDRELSDLVETTGSSEHAGGVRGAVDRLTLEIEQSLRQEKTLVVWLFDATPSMKDRREVIADRFENVYRQLGLLGVGGNGALKTVVATFGRNIEYLTRRPVDDVGSVQKAIRKIKDDGDDEHGAVENVFGAAINVSERFRSFRTGKKERRRVMVVIVTDERGSDFSRVEEAIVHLRKLGMRAFCVGDDAVFGRQKHFFSYIFRDGFRGLAYTLRGPETPRLENLQLASWGDRGDRLDELSSGFGPYALCRLCEETGGLYLISEELRGPKFDPAVLRRYLPDYRPLREYEAELTKNAAKAGLVAAAKVSVDDSGDSTTAGKIPRPRLVFRADNDNTLRQQITEAQKPLAELDYRLNEMHVFLEAGEKDRPRLDTPRWRASFDLAMGRILAMRARALGYNMMLAEMKITPRPFQNQNDNTWRIVPASEEHAPPRIQKFAKRAREYLLGVIESHHGTQWEVLAKQEIKSPMAWDWESYHFEYPPPPPPRPPRNPVQLEEDRQQQMMRRPQEQVSHVPPKL